MDYVRLRDDLAREEVLIPAYDDVAEPDIGIGEAYLSKDELTGAYLIGDNDDDTKPHYLADKREFYVHGIDLDYVGGE
jgi:hypothetical protein